MILRQAGYVIHETSILADALLTMESDVIDGVLICNSRKQQEWFVTQAMNIRSLLPILCIKNHPYEQCAKGCTGGSMANSNLSWPFSHVPSEYGVRGHRSAKIGINPEKG
jgi:hypothetical protein